LKAKELLKFLRILVETGVANGDGGDVGELVSVSVLIGNLDGELPKPWILFDLGFDSFKGDDDNGDDGDGDG